MADSEHIKAIKAEGIREALRYAQQQMHDGIDPVEEICFVEAYADLIDPTVTNQPDVQRSSEQK